MSCKVQDGAASQGLVLVQHSLIHAQQVAIQQRAQHHVQQLPQSLCRVLLWAAAATLHAAVRHVAALRQRRWRLLLLLLLWLLVLLETLPVMRLLGA